LGWFGDRPAVTESQLELLLRQTIAKYILDHEMQMWLGSRFRDELAFEIAEALRADARALGESLWTKGQA
jgi:hypothetical protein